jgi:hypothetical protein
MGRGLSLKEIIALMKLAESSPCEITEKDKQPAGAEEEREFMSAQELWRERQEQIEE